MNNTATITSDGINVFVTARVKADPIGRVILTVLVLAAFVLYFVVLYAVDMKEVGPVILGFLGFGFILIYFPGRYLLWNWFGEESIVVNTKTISYTRNYGLFQTNLTTLPFDQLGTTVTSFPIHGKPMGKIIFFNYPKENPLPEPISESSVLLSKEQLEEIDELISQVFVNDYFAQNKYLGFSEN